MSGSSSTNKLTTTASLFFALLPLLAFVAAAPDCETQLAGTFGILGLGLRYTMQIHLLKNGSSLIDPKRLAELNQLVVQLYSNSTACPDLVPVNTTAGAMVNTQEFGGCSSNDTNTCVIGYHSDYSESGRDLNRIAQAAFSCATNLLMSPGEGSCPSEPYNKLKLLGLLAIPVFFIGVCLCLNPPRCERRRPRVALAAGHDRLLPEGHDVELTNPSAQPNEEQPER